MHAKQLRVVIEDGLIPALEVLGYVYLLEATATPWATPWATAWAMVQPASFGEATAT